MGAHDWPERRPGRLTSCVRLDEMPSRAERVVANPGVEQLLPISGTEPSQAKLLRTRWVFRAACPLAPCRLLGPVGAMAPSPCYATRDGDASRWRAWRGC